MIQIAPSILSADFACLGKEVQKITEAGADLVHIDIMDGCFVENITFGHAVVKAVRPYTKLPFDVHLMIQNPQNQISKFVAAGANLITVHYEACQDLSATIEQIKALGVKVGVSVKPATDIAVLSPYLDDIDLILIMTVEPGKGGQQFMEDMLPKIAQAKQMAQGKEIDIEVDGGINQSTAKLCQNAGANILVAGNYIFTNLSYKEAINNLR